TVPEDHQALVVVPVVNDVLQYIRLRTARDGREEVTGDNLAALRETFCLNVLPRSRDHLGLVIQNTTQLGVRLQNRQEERPLTAAHIDQCLKGREVISRYYRWRFAS